MKINLTKLRELAENKLDIHAAAALTLIGEIERLRGVLEFYGDEVKWERAFDSDRNRLSRNFLARADYSDGIDSAGGRAREALAAHKERFEK